MTVAAIWVGFGLVGLALGEVSYRLNLGPRERLTAGTILLWLIGVLIPPLSFIFGVSGIGLWLFDPAILARKYSIGVMWPDWWGRIQYRRHRAWRWIWYLGRPPAESYLSDWSDVPRAWKQ